MAPPIRTKNQVKEHLRVDIIYYCNSCQSFAIPQAQLFIGTNSGFPTKLKQYIHWLTFDVCSLFQTQDM